MRKRSHGMTSPDIANLSLRNYGFQTAQFPLHEPAGSEELLMRRTLNDFIERGWDVKGILREREEAARLLRKHEGYLWFLHIQKAGGTAICNQLIRMQRSSGVSDGALKAQDACYLGGLNLKKGCSHDFWLNGYHDKVGCIEARTDDLDDLRQTWAINGSKEEKLAAREIALHLERLERKMKLADAKNWVVASEKHFMPRPALKSWLIERDARTVQAFSKWSFLINLRHPVDRIFSAFHFHTWFKPCGGNFTHCLSTTLMTQGPHRNKLVKEISGWYLPCEVGPLAVSTDREGRLGPLVEFPPCGEVLKEASEEDLLYAKFFLLRFLPIIILENSVPLPRQVEFSVLNSSSEVVPDGVRVIKVNEGTYKNAKMSRADYQRAASLNALDLELYQFAVELQQTSGPFLRDDA